MPETSGPETSGAGMNPDWCSNRPGSAGLSIHRQAGRRTVFEPGSLHYCTCTPIRSACGKGRTAPGEHAKFAGAIVVWFLSYGVDTTRSGSGGADREFSRTRRGQPLLPQDDVGLVDVARDTT